MSSDWLSGSGLVEDNKVYDGSDISAKKGVKSRESCAKLCAEEDRCRYWSYHAGWDICDLKTSNSGRRGDTSYVSGKNPVS
jgi:hypothetical protein